MASVAAGVADKDASALVLVLRPVTPAERRCTLPATNHGIQDEETPPVRALQQYAAVAGAEDAPVLVAWLQAPRTGSNSTDRFGAAGGRNEAGHLVAEEADEGEACRRGGRGTGGGKAGW